MSGVFLGVGVALLVLDRVIYGATVIRIQEWLTYYIYYYRPMFQRKQFFLLVGLAICVCILINYLIFFEVNIWLYVLLFLALLGLIYVMLVLLTLYDSLVLKDIDLRFHFYSLENDFRQIFTLALFFPFIYLAYLLKAALYLFRYPAQGIYGFRSFAGLAGSLCLGLGLIMLFL
jgi:hypothetical protein